MKTLAVCLLMDLLGAVFAMDRVAAQTAPAAGTQLITLGTAGGPLPRADRAQSSNLLVVNGALYLIDAGGSVTSRVVQSGHDFRKIGKIFITHPHSDHTAGLATLMVSQWEYQRAEPTDIYGGGVEALVKSGLLSYGPDLRDIVRRGAVYVDRILRGEKPADLPVQVPVKFEMAANARTAKALGLTVPPSILLRADEVIE